MNKTRMRYIVILAMFMLLIASFDLVSHGIADPRAPSAHLNFNKIPGSENYTGGIVSLDIKIKLERIRIALYDDNLHLMETGLLSDYSKNTIEKYYLDFWDANNNSRLESADVFYVFGKGEVQTSWGVVLSYESSGDIIASNTISGKVFSLGEKIEDDYNLGIFSFIIVLCIISIIVILVFYYRRKE